MKILSLFDGISCARVACDRAGIPVETYWACEIDKYAIQVSEKNYPDIIQMGNVSQIIFDNYPEYSVMKSCERKNGMLCYNDYTMWNGNLDLVIGGSPCQDLSIAKANREGLKGKRSGLFYEYLRIVKEAKPKFFVLENVASMPKEAKKTITEELWGIEPVMINAALVSAQNRKRYFWVGSLQEDGTYKQVGIPLPEDRGIMLKDILEQEVDEKYYINPKALEKYIKNGKPKNLCIDKSKALIASSHKGYGNDGCSVVLDKHRNEKLKSNTIIRKLTPVEAERLQSLPDHYTAMGADGKPISNTQRYKCLGNAFNVDVVAHILKHLTKK